MSHKKRKQPLLSDNDVKRIRDKVTDVDSLSKMNPMYGTVYHGCTHAEYMAMVRPPKPKKEVKDRDEGDKLLSDRQSSRRYGWGR